VTNAIQPISLREVTAAHSARGVGCSPASSRRLT